MPEELKNLKDKSRRSFLSKLWLLLGIALLVELIWVLVSFLRPRKPKAETDAQNTIIAGPVDRFEPGSVTAFPQGKFYLARLEGGGFLALSRVCTHLGCTVPWVPDENRFICPCHASSFDITGNVINPPAPRALDLFQIEIENNIVKVFLDRTVKRKRYRDDQVTKPF